MTPESAARGAQVNPKTPKDHQSETRPLRNVSPDELGSLAALAKISELVNASYDMDDVLRRIMDLVIETMGAERGFVMLDHGGDQPEIAVARGISLDTTGSEESWYSKTVVQQVLSRGEPVLSVDAVRDSRFS
ncbi:MAG: GAF domain-containing protein, partial [Candidatus Xenobia bacterium]